MSSSAEPVVFEAKDRPLRRDVGRLGAVLGQVLREAAPAPVYETVEAARRAARHRRRGDPAAGERLRALLAELTPELALEVVRAFSAYFGVVNTAEQVHRMRRSLDYQVAGVAQPASSRAVTAELVGRGVTVEQLRGALDGLLVEPVFTAHPTEVVRRSLLKKDQRLARALVERFRREGRDPVALEILDEAVALEIASAWQTEEQLPARPSVADEVEHVLFFLSDVLYRVVPAVHEELERSLAQAWGRPVPLERPVLRFASWVGGDMDGNPNVGAHTIRATLARHVELAVRRYVEELRGLHEHLSQASSRVAVDAAVLRRADEHAEALPEGGRNVPERYRATPYRRLLWFLVERLERTARAEPGGFAGPDAFEQDLRQMITSLERHGGRRAGALLVRRTLRRLQVFGFHLAALDVRQDAAVHRRVVGALLGDPGFPERTAAERTALLSRALAEDPPEPGPLDEEARATLDVFAALAEARTRYGARALGPFIVSMAQGPDDALAVLLLARVGGCTDGARVPLDVAPLFETVDDLAGGPEVLAALVRDPTYAAHLQDRGRRQVVMLGYSDSNKDGGIAASRVALDRAQSALVACARAHDLTLTLFHGRGGSISRGGSKPRDGILAAPPGALDGHARHTEQGEIVAGKYGLRGIAARTLDVTLAALLERTADGSAAHAATPAERAVAETLASASRARYRALVDHPDFPELFTGMTPIDVIERLQVGSRPARRRAMRGVTDLRAIPWVFAWTQCRAVLPGWFGVGSGLRAASEAHGPEVVRAALSDWPFLATLLADVEMVLAKCDLEIAALYAELAGEAGRQLFPVIREEYDVTLEAVLELRGGSGLLARDPGLRRAIRLRNPYVDPLSFVQVDALRRWRAGDRQDPALERVLIQTLRGISRGLRNTG